MILMIPGRRQFIGSVIGAFANTDLPFVAEGIPAYSRPVMTLTDYERSLEIANLYGRTLNDLKQYKMFTKLGNGEQILTPVTDTIDKYIEDDEFCVAFKAKTINFKVECIITHIGLLTSRGQRIACKKVGPVNINPGDSFTFSYTACVPPIRMDS